MVLHHINGEHAFTVISQDVCGAIQVPCKCKTPALHCGFTYSRLLTNIKHNSVYFLTQSTITVYNYKTVT